MAKMSLLDIVQDIANDLETDEISTIDETVEALQIAQIVKTTYFEMMGNRNWDHLKRTFQFESSTTADKPTHIKTPEALKELVTFNYNKRKNTDNRDRFGEVRWLEPEEFLWKTNSRNTSEAFITSVVDFGGINLNIRNEKQPEWYTSFDGEYIVLDSFDNEVDSTIQNSKTQAVGYLEPTWSQVDSFIPDLPSEAFPALLAEAKSTAFFVIKQQVNSKAEQKSSRQTRWLSRKDWKIHGGVRYANYGRTKTYSSSTRQNPLFDKG